MLSLSDNNTIIGLFSYLENIAIYIYMLFKKTKQKKKTWPIHQQQTHSEFL